jgi:hypothetical protein
VGVAESRFFFFKDKAGELSLDCSPIKIREVCQVTVSSRLHMLTIIVRVTVSNFEFDTSFVRIYE